MSFKTKSFCSALVASASLTLIGLLALSTAARAVDLTPDTTRYLSDPSFLPLEGQVYSETVYIHSDRDEDLFSGLLKEHFSTTANEGEQILRYGLTDRLSLYVAGSYSGATQTSSGSYDGFSFGPTSTSRNDFNDPSFGATYRIVEQTDSPLSFDVTGTYSPSVVEHSSQSGQLSFFINRETRFITIQGEAGARFIDSYDGPGTAFAARQRDYWNYFFGIRSQMRLTDALAVNSGVVYSKNTDIAYDGEFYNSQDGTWTPFVSLSYGIVPGKVDVAFEYDHAFIGDTKQNGPIGPIGLGMIDRIGPIGKFDNDSQNTYAVHLRLLF